MRFTSSLALGMFLTAIFTSLVHMGVVQHERCAEHGELVEVTGTAAGHHDDVLAVLFAASSAEGHEDDHCPLTLNPSTRAFSSFHCAHDLLAAPSDPETIPAAAGAVIGVDLLRIAPKTSPPRAT